MDIHELVNKASHRDLTDAGALVDYFESVRLLEKEDFKAAHKHNKEIRKFSALYARQQTSLKMFELHKKALLLDAPHDFDCFCQYLEFDRNPEKRFYLPRRHYLKRRADAYQKITDGQLDLLTISQPKRTGKSQLGIFFLLFMSGRRPEGSSLVEGSGDDLIDSWYKGCTEIMESPEYLYADVFPAAKIVATNAKAHTINLKNKSRFPSMMFRSCDAKQVGLSEANVVLILDDMIDGDKEKKNRELLDGKWNMTRGDIMGRRIEGAPIIAMNTRYSLYDVNGHLLEHAQNVGWRYEQIEDPALDPITDESNYEHWFFDGVERRKIFTTDYLRKERELLSAEQWESEFQQQPFESKGLMFPEDKLNRYFKLPADQEPDAVIAVCDTAEGGGDSVMLPVAYIYGEDVFIEDCVFDDSPPDSTKPQCAKKLVQHKVSVATFESNNAGTYYARDVEKIVGELGGKCSIRTKRTISNKRTRIETASDGVIKHFYFKDKSLYKPTDQYGMMMKELVTYTRTGKVKHDDSPDGMSLLENEIRSLVGNKVEVFKRPW